jgi:hypothetical protein
MKEGARTRFVIITNAVLTTVKDILSLQKVYLTPSFFIPSPIPIIPFITYLLYFASRAPRDSEKNHSIPSRSPTVPSRPVPYSPAVFYFILQVNFFSKIFSSGKRFLVVTRSRPYLTIFS